ncbi:hypothetical protein PVAP13_5NG036724 [Panicum virgatum]|uniref:Uncharacterized protein n=1 Tax=Panicum virgatum TaxID=38727 RepID=A0A8T0RMU7_PANVG|nr:hypothetical protein PVAP13_5NG036724 [Panicum virgatum]KAG2586187.1 hypothetical protein PVAP13_5NG036724 [Panicum virgatum]KAG2586188.1 hypothetical protein PVAP13_5NG036724 [Panicum virgatum]KAG2586192.1 hypothetical protein PVAP13_5NG036724 [Panicum virgatum]
MPHHPPQRRTFPAMSISSRRARRRFHRHQQHLGLGHRRGCRPVDGTTPAATSVPSSGALLPSGSSTRRDPPPVPDAGKSGFCSRSCTILPTPRRRIHRHELRLGLGRRRGRRPVDGTTPAASTAPSSGSWRSSPKRGLSWRRPPRRPRPSVTLLQYTPQLPSLSPPRDPPQNCRPDPPRSL